MKKDLFLWLRPGIRILRNEGLTFLMDQNGSVIQADDPSLSMLELAQRLNGEETESSLLSNPCHSCLLPLLKERGWLVTLRSPLKQLLSEHFELSREISAFAHLYPDELDWHFELLTKKKVLIIGLGGIGSHVAFAMSANGIGSLTIVDPDHIESTNLNRQFLFSSHDIGRPKVEIAARELSSRFPKTNVQGIHKDFDDFELAKNLIEGKDLIVICGESGILQDNPQLLKNIPIILAGYRGAVGVIWPLLDPQQGSACWECVMAYHFRSVLENIEKCSLSRNDSWNPSGFTVNSMTAAMCSNICVGFLSEQGSALQWIGVQLQMSCANFNVEKSRVTPASCEHSALT